jgi:hypothetical protein
MSNEPKDNTGDFTGRESVIKVDVPSPQSDSYLNQQIQSFLDETMYRPLQEIAKTVEHQLSNDGHGYQDNLAKTMERPVVKEAKALLAVSHRIKRESADLIQKAKVADMSEDNLREINQQLVAELEKNVAYVQKLSTIAIGKAYHEDRQRKAKTRYFVAFAVALFMLAASVAYFKYGLTAEQKKYVRIQLENWHLLKQVQETEQTVAQKQQEIREKARTIADQTKELQEKEQNIKEVKRSASEKEQMLTQTREVLTQTQQELSAKDYITNKLQQLKEFAGELERWREAGHLLEHEFQGTQQTVLVKHSAMSKEFDQLLDAKQLWAELKMPIEEKLLTVQARFYGFQESQLRFLQQGGQTCQASLRELATFAEELQNKQPHLLQYAEKKMSDVPGIEQEFASLENTYQKHAKTTWPGITALRQQLHLFHKEPFAIYTKLLEYYQRHTMDHKIFVMAYQHLKEAETIYQTVEQIKSQLSDVAGSLDRNKQNQNLVQAGQQITVLRQELSLLYRPFMNLLSDATWAEEIAGWGEQQKRESDCLQFGRKMAEHDQKSDSLMSQVHIVYQKIGKIAKYCVEAKEFWQQERARQKNMAGKIAEKPKVDSKAAATPTSTQPSLQPTALPANQLGVLYQNISGYLQMASSECVVTTKIFSRQQDRLVLQSHLIAKVFAAIYRQEAVSVSCLLFQALAPQDEVGNRILQRGDVTWFYDERQNSLVRLTPQLLRVSPNQQFQQTVDIVELIWWSDGEYEIKQGEKITSDKGEKFYRLLFSAREQTVYPWVYCHYSVAQEMPVKLEYCDANRRPSLVIYCRTFQTTPLGKRAVRCMVMDLANPDFLMEVEYLNIKQKEFPEYIFQKENIAGLK